MISLLNQLHYYQESNAIRTNKIRFTRDLHKIRAYLLRYGSLLDDFRKSVTFLKITNNPAMATPARRISTILLQKECTNLLTEIKRLTRDRNMHEMRLANVIQPVCPFLALRTI